MEKYKVAKADLPVVLYAVKAIPAASDLSLIRFVAADTEFSPSTEEDVLESFNKSDLHSPYIQTWDSPSRGRAAADRVKKRYGGEWMCFTIDPQELETVLRSPKYEHGGEHSGEYLVLHRIPFRAVLDNELRAQNQNEMLMKLTEKSEHLKRLDRSAESIVDDPHTERRLPRCLSREEDPHHSAGRIIRIIAQPRRPTKYATRTSARGRAAKRLETPRDFSTSNDVEEDHEIELQRDLGHNDVSIDRTREPRNLSEELPGNTSTSVQQEFQPIGETLEQPISNESTVQTMEAHTNRSRSKSWARRVLSARQIEDKGILKTQYLVDWEPDSDGEFIPQWDTGEFLDEEERRVLEAETKAWKSLPFRQRIKNKSRTRTIVYEEFDHLFPGGLHAHGYLVDCGADIQPSWFRRDDHKVKDLVADFDAKKPGWQASNAARVRKRKYGQSLWWL